MQFALAAVHNRISRPTDFKNNVFLAMGVSQRLEPEWQQRGDFHFLILLLRTTLVIV